MHGYNANTLNSYFSQDFTEKRFLNDHVQTAHAGGAGGAGGGAGGGSGCPEGVPLKCPNCFREFAYKTSLKQHLKKQASMSRIF